MELLRLGVCTLLVFCSASWVVSSSRAVASPRCDAMLDLSSNVSSLSGGNGNIHSRSLSPWRWTSTTVKDRIPSTIWEAECISSFCSSPNPGQTNRQDLTSVPIHQNILVLNRQDKGCHYTASYRSVAVGCTCVWTKTIQN
ncbi:interleukin 17a/f2 [Stegastes partitus]|uniref:Interleukin-17A-like n=1 Tax=Stegastes partitus TaxID=144197 RepID=A0A3B5AH54_9TELE|nr:PREDICTED: interleukin-17A-like [Stegastes partitus]